MIPIAEFQQRALTGPVMREQEFDKAFSRKVRELVSRYGIQYDPEVIVADDNLADATFQAGVELLVETGIYHRETQRLVVLSREEVNQIVSEAWNGPKKETFGKGKDTVSIKRRTCEDPRPPVFFLGTTGTPSSEELYLPWLQSFAQEETADGMLSFGLVVAAGGMRNKLGLPGEVACVLSEVAAVQEVARRVGKPDMFFGRSSATTPEAIVASFFPGGLERHNSVIAIHMMPEQKLDWSRLTLALFTQQRGIVPWTTATSLMGAICRGPEDTAVAMVANLISQLGYGRGTMGTTSAVALGGVTAGPQNMWADSAATRASERHIGIPMGASTRSSAGAGTEMSLFEKAALTVDYVASGCAWIGGAGCRVGSPATNTTTGLEGRIIGETLRVVAGMTRDRSNELLKKILALYEDRIGSPPEGQTFGQLYDVKRVQPTEEYLAVYERAKERLAGLGVPYH